ncbi:hypothetical protein J7T55_012071 [Diaporthe amygdali]|uniref:uncharacterized protein n=1 Tax=Phomopsis amygdali TaxID=1214568 RepID=UPI0022FEE277|nr:uncharacterized protein J7T55_012071 [Diaporthe amygdali]KAJ0123606.1 hypothetical protein J7T55_012071 [Diaporthe amygdali]
MLCLGLLFLFQLFIATPVCSLRKRDVRVTLSNGTTVIGYDAEGLSTFQGIPYAQPPVGNLRLRPPQPFTTPLGTINATRSAKACPQLVLNLNSSSLLESVAGRLVNTPFAQNNLLDASEDCLTLNVITPPNTVPGDNLPVMFWIFGGAFELGWSSLFNGSSFVLDSIAMGKPVVWVAVNYRVAGFGLMPGKEILAEGSTNLALRDQRLGLQWVADNIAQFGGDPEKVVIFGESAGSISVHLQMMLNGGDNTYKGRPLFRGAIMDSGSVIPYARVDAPQAQQVYDAVVVAGGCEQSGDTLACLRSLPYQDFLNAATSVPGLFDYNGGQLSYGSAPRPDGDILPDTTDVLSATGRYAKVPFIVGDQEDEGTLFSLTQTNLSTTDDVVTYMNDFYFPQSDRSVVQGYVDTYPDSSSEGSPFGTGPFNDVYPQFKRLAALLGDQLFTLQRRRVLQLNAQLGGPPAWTYLGKYFYGTPVLGTFHATDILHGFDYLGDTDAKKTIHAYYISFVNTLDPNNGTASEFTQWPQWTEQGREILEMGNSVDNSVGTDDFREESYQYLLANIGNLHT